MTTPEPVLTTPATTPGASVPGTSPRTLDLALAAPLAVVTALWTATLHAAAAPGGGWVGFAADVTVTASLAGIAALAALTLLRGPGRSPGLLARTAAGAAAVAAVSGGLTPLRTVLLPGGHLGHGAAGHVLDHTATALVVALPLAALLAWVTGALVEGPAPAAPTVPAAAPVGAGRPRRLARRAVVAVAASAAVVSASLVGAAAPAATAATLTPLQSCLSGGAATTSFDVVALDVDITLNAYGDHDPAGKMYALADRVADIRAAEKSRVVTPGLKDDPIQPLVIRANQGDCVEIRYANNATGGAYGVHIDGLAYTATSSGDALGANAPSQPGTGGTTTYRFYVPDDKTLEGAHYLHPGPGYRNQVGHGLFGTLVVEPPGSTYWNTSTPNTPLRSGWDAIIRPGAAASSCAGSNCQFREHLLLHHEVGNDNELIFHPDGSALPQQDDVTGGYRPAAFALNYRSEPFRNRLLNFPKEKSHSYSSYTFGEPATPILRAYLGDPTKIRIMHAGGEKFHVYHLHGGGDRWRANPVADWTYNYSQTGLLKDPPTTASASQRLDSQSLGPGESFNLEIEGGAGGVQQSVGDFLFHCHIAKHYVAGMWSIWRVNNVKQPDLVPLSDRPVPPTAIDSTSLFGKSFTQYNADGTTTTVKLDTLTKLDQWIRRQLPPAGIPASAQDPSVWDWKTVTPSKGATPVYLGAVADPTVAPDSPRGVPGQPNLLAIDGSFPLVENRPRILFDSTTGLVAYPLLRPKIGTRPPFTANGHSGTPYLGDTANAAPKAGLLVDPYAGRRDGLCPVNRTVRQYNVVAIEKPYIRDAKGTVDPEGKVFVLAQDKDAVLNGTKPVQPLAIRANQGDCVGVTLTNEMTDANAFDKWSKTTMHIHHVQFDPAGSDGVSAGFAFEHSVRPYKAEDGTLTAATAAGATTITLTSVTKLVGKDSNGNATKPYVMVGQGTNQPEIRQVVSVNTKNNTVTLDSALQYAHAAGQYAGTEFIQYRWYPDVLLDNVFWHDHVDGIHGWGHGLVGQLLVEPKGSQWLDPKTNQPVDSGTFVNIVPPAGEKLAPGVVEGPYRELVLWTIHDNDKADFSSVNLRANPLGDRGNGPDKFSSYTYGDPVTPLARIYQDEPLVVRTINVSPTVDTLHFQGARFAKELRYQTTSGSPQVGLTDTIHHGVSEKYTLVLNGKNPDERLRPGDYLYFDGDENRLQQGAWGIVRVLDKLDPNLPPLPGIAGPTTPYVQPTVTGLPAPATTDIGNPCTADQPVRSWSITATNVPSQTRVKSAFVPTADVASVVAGTKPLEPLVLHAVAGDCVKVTFTNALSQPSGFAVSGVDREQGSAGVTVGWNTNQTVAPGATRDYVYSVPSSRLGTLSIADMVGPGATKLGLYGALVVAPKASAAGATTTFTDPVTGAAKDVGTQVVVHAPGWQAPDYRDFTVIMADDDPRMGQDFMPYPTNVASGRTWLNYGAAPLGDTTFTDPGSSPWLTSYAGDPVVFHTLVAPGSEQPHSFSLGGLAWLSDWRESQSNALTAVGVGPWESADGLILGGAGGQAQAPGDYFYGDLRRPFTQAGLWGLQRVLPADGSKGCPILLVDGRSCTAATLAVNAGADQTVTEGTTVTLKATVTGTATSYLWERTDVTPAVSVGTTATATLTAPLASTLNGTPMRFRVTVKDANGATATDEVLVTVTSAVTVTSPTANAGADRTVARGSVVTLAGTATAGVSYAWTQTGGPAVTLTGADTLTPSFTYPWFDASAANATQPVTLQLTVTGAGGTTPATDSVVISPAAADTLAISQATYRVNKRFWRIDGTSSAPSGQTVTVHLGSTANGTPVIGSAAVGTNGQWSVQVTVASGSPAIPTGTSAVVTAESQLGGTATFTAVVN